jgi:ATP-binding cassette, subfamily C, bacterial EexD
VMIAATLLLSRALAPVESAVAGWRGLLEARDAWLRVRRVASGSSPAASTPFAAPARFAAPSLGGLVVESVTLGRGHRPALRQVNVELRPGETVGLLGPAGCGKSALARLLVGAVAPTAGSVRLDGLEMSRWPSERVKASVGYLPQEVSLFEATVAQNIARLSDPVAEDVLEAAQRAGVHDAIMRLPDGYDTRVDDVSLPLPASLRRRIGLARALYGRPRLVVLDDPSAGLDAEAEEALVRTLETLKQERVTLVVATHRSRLVALLDRAILLNEGRIERDGPASAVTAGPRRAALAPVDARSAGVMAKRAPPSSPRPDMARMAG